MRSRTLTMRLAAVCLVTLLGSTAFGEPVLVNITATASEDLGEKPDVFGVAFWANRDIRIQQIRYDLSFAAGTPFFDTVVHDCGAYDFTVLPDTHFPAIVSSDVGVTSYTSADCSPLLTVNFNDFAPGETLYFAIDVDTLTGDTFTAADFAGARMEVLLSMQPAFPGAGAVEIPLTFEDREGAAIAEYSDEVEAVPEPTTVALITGGLACAGVFTRRRKRPRT